MHLCLLIPFDAIDFQQMDRALDQSMCTQHHLLLCIVLDECQIQSENFLFFQMPSDMDIFLVPRHQSTGNINFCRKQLEHLIHMTYNAQTNMLDGSHHNPFFLV